MYYNSNLDFFNYKSIERSPLVWLSVQRVCGMRHARYIKF